MKRYFVFQVNSHSQFVDGKLTPFVGHTRGKLGMGAKAQKKT
jgi:hypothetical protein